MTQQINLLDESLLQGRDWANGMVVLSTLVTASLALASHWGFEQWQWMQTTKQASQADAVREASGAALQQVNDQLTQLQAQVTADDQMRRAAAALIDPPQNCVQRFDQLVGTLSPRMWMHSVEFNGSRGVHLLVSGLRQADLAIYAEALSGSKAFAGLPIEILSIERQVLTEPDSEDANGVQRKGKSMPYYTFELSGSDSSAGKDAS